MDHRRLTGTSCQVRSISRWRIAVAWLALLSFWHLSAPTACAQANPPARVLVIYSFGRDYPPFHEMSRQFVNRLREISPRPIELVESSLEMARFDGPDKDNPLTEFLDAVYREHPPDLVVLVGAPSMQFMSRNRERLFKDTPFLILGADKRRIPEISEDDDLTCIPTHVDLAAMMEDVRMLRPRMNRLLVVNGNAPVDRFWESEMRREFPPLLPGVEIEWLGDLPFAAMLDRVAAAAPNDAVFYGIVSRDHDGIPHEQDSALQAVAMRASAPVFGWSIEQLGKGIVGGRLLPLGDGGRKAADVAAKLLSGEPAASLAVTPITALSPEYDDRQLRRWNIPRSLLSKESRIRFEPASLWQTHRTTVTIALLVGLLQTLMIVMLLAARRQSRERGEALELAAEAAHVGFWQGDLSSGEIKASPKCCELIGIQCTKILKLENIMRLVHPDDAQRVRETLDTSLQASGFHQIEHRIVHPDKGVRWIASMGSTVTDGSSRRCRGLSIDVTDRKQMEEASARQRSEIEHLSRLASLGELSGAMAHELNQPLGSILANAQAVRRMMEDAGAATEEWREVIDDIISEDQRAGAVIRRLRQLVRRGETLRERVDINDYIRGMLELLRGEMIDKKIVVETSLCKTEPIVIGDPVQLQQVILNLAANARDAMEACPPHGRRLMVRTSCQAERVVIEVCDTGPGHDGDPDMLFQSFYTTKAQGLGLGLPICRSILDAHDGTIRCSPADGGGMLIRIELPRADTP